ncbi:hypothetical protein ES703_53249 [subsurface metagenome]
MAEIRPQALAEVKAALERFEAEVKGSKLSKDSQQTYSSHARQFVRWLEGVFEPGGTL